MKLFELIQDLAALAAISLFVGAAVYCSAGISAAMISWRLVQ